MNKRFLPLLLLLTGISLKGWALISISVSGNANTVPALATSYASLASAFTALNSVTAVNGPVILNMNAGTTESVSSQLTLSLAGSLTNSISFIKSGTGANPKLTRTDAGTQAPTVLGGFGDAIIRIDGSDNIHFNGLDLAAGNMGIEYGFYTQKTSATNACQKISIKNGVVTMTKGTSAYVIGIYLSNGTTSATSKAGYTISASSGQTENVTITGMTIQNVHTGILSYGNGSSSFNDRNLIIGAAGSGNGNIIQNFGGGSATTAYGIYVYRCVNANIDFNTIQNAAGGGIAHTADLDGIYMYYAGGNTTTNNNNIVLTNSSSASNFWIYTYFHQGNPVISNNTFGAGTLNSNGTCALIYNVYYTDSNVVISNNSTTGTITKSGSVGSFYGYYEDGSTMGSEIIQGNNFSNINVSGTTLLYGIYISTDPGQQQQIYQNTISNITAGTQVCTGMLIGQTGYCSVYQNLVYNLSGSGLVKGIRTYSAGDSLARVFSNKVYNLTTNSTATTSGLLTGIEVDGSLVERFNVRVYNNLVGNLYAPVSNSIDCIRGLDCSYFGSYGNSEFANNTVFLNAASTGTNFGTSGIHQYAYAISNENRFLSRNNVVVNLSTPNGTGVTAAFRRSSEQQQNFNPYSNRNLYYCGTPSANRVIYSNSVQNISTLSDYKNYLLGINAGAELNSFSEAVNFLSTLGSNPDFLKIDSSLFSSAEGNAQDIAWLNQDYGFQPRYGNAMYSGSGLAPDLGAWEMNGTGTPLCSGTPSMADAQVSNYNPCTDSAFTLYLTQVYGPGTQYQWYNSSDSASGYTAIAGATQSVYIVSNHSDTWYRCNVTCSNGNQTIQSTPVKSDISMMNGTYTIDNTGAGNFISFAAAIQALHCRGTSGPVVFSIPAGQVFAESVNLIINYNSMYPVTFQKTGLGANPKITRTGNSNTTNYILQLKGADHIVFDGIDFEQGSTLTTQWVEFGVEITNASATDGAQYNVIKNGTISLSASNTNAIGIYLHSDATPATQFSGTNSYNRFLNMVIQNAFTGYKLNGYSMIVQDEGNEINTESGGFSVINTLGDRTTTGFIYGITATQQANFRVENTEIYSILPGGTSSAYGIYYYYADSTTIYINNNHIHDIEGVGNAVGINLVPQCNIVAQNNKIEAIASTSTSAYVKGINLTVSDTAKADGNRIFNLSSTGNTTTSIVTGMDVTMNSGLCQVSNNMISDLRSPNCTTTSSGVAGIALNSNSTAGQLQVYYNSVLLSDVGLNASYTSSCFDINSSASTIDMRNNIWINRSDVTTGTRAMAINKSNTTDNIDTASNNNVLYAGVADSKHALLYDFTNICITPATYKALSYITPAEQFTAAENVNFQTIGGGILRPSYTTPTICANRAKICNTMDHDFENELRSSTPDIGADEGVFVALNPACVNYVYPTNGQSGICPYENISLQWSLPSLGNTVALGYSVYFGTNPNPPYIGLTSGFSYPVSSLQPNTVYYWKVVARYNANDSAFCFIQSFTTTAAMVQSTQSAARCGTGVVNLSVNGTGPFNWYTTASGGTPVQTGNTYTPTVSATTTYYVAAADGYRMPQTCGASGTGIGTTSQVSTTTDYLTFNAISKFILDSVVVYPNASGSLIIQLKNSAGTTLLTKTISVGSTQINLPLNVSLGWVIDPGTAYRLQKSSSLLLTRNTSGMVFPYTVPGVVSITGSTGGATSSYNFFYAWKVRGICESPRQSVVATVYNITGSQSNVHACQTYTWPFSAATYTQSGTYTHSILVGTGCTQRDTLNLNIHQPGSTSYAVTACGSYTWPGNNATYTNAGTYTTTLSDQGGCDSVVSFTLSIISCQHDLTVKAFLEGYYAGSGTLFPVMAQQGLSSPMSACDSLTVELRNATNYSLTASQKVVLPVSGQVSLSFMNVPGWHYLVLKHRNAIETWSATPLNFPLGNTSLVYDFTTSAAQAYGNNEQEMEPGVWALYSGDVTQDGNIDLVDYVVTETAVSEYLFGYERCDLNGDGNVDLLDYPLLENNIASYIFVQRP